MRFPASAGKYPCNKQLMVRPHQLLSVQHCYRTCETYKGPKTEGMRNAALTLRRGEPWGALLEQLADLRRRSLIQPRLKLPIEFHVGFS